MWWSLQFQFWPWPTVSALICFYDPTGTRWRSGISATLTNSWVVSVGPLRLYHVSHHQSRASYTPMPSYLTTGTYQNNSLHIYKNDPWNNQVSCWHAFCFWYPWLIQGCGSSFPYPNVSDAYNPQRSKTEQQQCTMVTDHTAWCNLRRQIVLAAQSHVQFGREISTSWNYFAFFHTISLVTSLNGFRGCLWVIGLSSWVYCFKGKLTAAFHRRSSFIQQKALKDSLPNFLLAAQVILLPSAFSIGSLPTYIIWTITSWDWEFSVTETIVGFFFPEGSAKGVHVLLMRTTIIRWIRVSEQGTWGHTWCLFCSSRQKKKKVKEGHESDCNVRLLDFPVCTKYN